MLITDIISSIVIAFAFFTIIPMPKLDWTGRRMSYVPLMMPLVGLMNGLIAYGIFAILNSLHFSTFFKAVIMCLYYVVYTGGLHIDGLLDTADAYFSRWDRAKKLEIMKDSNVGAFAVLTLVFIVLFKTAVFNELFTNSKKNGIILIFIPVISRILQSSMLYIFPSAKKDGLTKMYGILDKRHTIIHLILFILMSGIFTPTESMPQWAQYINIINPFYYFMRVIRMVLLKGSGFMDILREFISLAIYAVVVLSLAVWRYRKVT